MVEKQIRIGHLYPRDMNIYGDNGNVLVLQKRLTRRGYIVDVVDINPGDQIPEDIDILVSGGGQDKGQIKVMKDLQQKADQLRKLADDGIPMLVVCGTYQLFGHRFVTREGEEIPGIGIFDMETIAGNERLIGNIETTNSELNLIGYENHSGLTHLAEGQKPLAIVKAGAGNNGQDGTEGAVAKNVIGTYLHGPILPKNPVLADKLITAAVKNKFGAKKLEELDDSLANQAAEVAKNRPR